MRRLARVLMLGIVLIANCLVGQAYAQVDEISRLDDQFRALFSQGRYAEAAAIEERVVKLTEALRGSNHPETAAALNNLGVVYANQAKYGPAIAAFTRAQAIEEKTKGSEHPDVAQTLSNLGSAYEEQGMHAEAIAAHTRALAIREKALGPEHPDVAQTLNNLGNALKDLDRYPEAIAAFARALTIEEKVLGPEHADVGTVLHNLGTLYDETDRHAEAIAAYTRALAIREKALGAEHPDVAQTLNNLGIVYWSQGKYSEADTVYARALAIRERALGPEHPDVAQTLANLGALNIALRDWASAENYGLRATTILERRSLLGIADVGKAPASTGKSEATRKSGSFLGAIKAAFRRSAAHQAPDLATTRETFLKAQWGLHSEAAAALSAMAARTVKGDHALASHVRERQDLIGEWQRRDLLRMAAVSRAPEERSMEEEAANVARLQGIETRIGAIDTVLKDRFPDYAALASPLPLALEDVQRYLRDDEALILTLDTGDGWRTLPEETFLWVVTKTQARWVRSDLGTSGLQREVAALRCGLDYGGSWLVSNSRCPMLTKVNHTEVDQQAGKPLPFDLVRAHALYQRLFGEVEELIKGKNLLIVPSGALTQLPFEVLVSAAPDLSLKGPIAMRKARWMIRDHAITVLPSTASLKALREFAKPSRASRPMIGFGNPLLDGGPLDAERARRAKLNSTCPVRAASLLRHRRGLAALSIKDGEADVAQIRAAIPLPETADELCAVAKNLHANARDVYLGARATVPEVERLSAAGELGKYHLVHFATHGALSGQISGSTEPGLLLTPPRTPSAANDGYLSASRIAGLKLDADWVILSACNTAAGGANDAEALSGLSRAFFYAGARALLVSHWSVNSDAAVSLITAAIGAMAADKTVGRAEALRRSELIEIDTRDPNPATWAPFIVVGEGAAGR